LDCRHRSNRRRSTLTVACFAWASAVGLTPVPADTANLQTIATPQGAGHQV